MNRRTSVERTSDRELIITRTFDCPARIVFEAWTKPQLLKGWLAPKSMDMSLVSGEADLRVGGWYRFWFGRVAERPLMALIGRYTEVTPPSRLAWTNEETDEGAVSTATFEEKDGRTLLVQRDLYPSKEALDRALAGMEEGLTEQFAQLDELLVALTASARRP